MTIAGRVEGLLFGSTLDRVEPVAQGEKKLKPKNLCLKTRPKDNPYEVWKSRDGLWTWNVLKKNQIDDHKPYATWFCYVVSPYAEEYGDCYVQDVKRGNTKVA
jgi:hypothetical protein